MIQVSELISTAKLEKSQQLAAKFKEVGVHFQKIKNLVSPQCAEKIENALTEEIEAEAKAIWK